MSAGTVTHYLRYARAFLAGFPGPLTETLAGLPAGQVTGYVLEQARRRRDRAPDMVMLPALRSLLRYLHAAGHTPLPLAGAVPAGRRWRPGLPRAASADHLRAVLAGCDRATAGGRRDHAIVLAMSRLALRGGEVAGLQLAPHTLRHTAAMNLLHAGVDITVIALWLGHESPVTTRIYLHADMALKEKAIARTAPPDTRAGRYQPPDELLAFLTQL